MDDVLDVSVQEWETVETESLYEYTWHDGLECYVPGCTSTTKFKKFQDFKSHWLGTHTQYKVFQKCGLCTFKHPKRSQVTRHYRRIHKHEPTEIHSESIENPRYINPGKYQMARNVVNIHLKEAAALERLHSISNPILQPTSTSVFQSRDQCVVPNFTDGTAKLHTKGEEPTKFKAPCDLDLF